MFLLALAAASLGAGLAVHWRSINGALAQHLRPSASRLA